MRFEKINDNKLKVILTNDELPSSNNLDEFINDSSFAKDSFLDILDEAFNEVGFDTKNYKIKIQAKELYNGNYVFVITKLLKLKNGKALVKPKRVLKTESKSSNYVIYQFDNFDDFCNFCKYLKTNNFTDLQTFSNDCKLYKYTNLYYLCVKNINEDYSEISNFYSSITEFSRFFSEKEIFASTLKEHGEIAIDNNALIIGQKYFV